MVDIPRAVLSDQFQEIVAGRRLVAAVFVTFRFDPEFFEQEVLPLFVSASLSHADVIRRVQMEDALKDVRHRIAVYYDRNGLEAGGGSAKLDIARIPISYPSGIFHSKNVFALVEDSEPNEEGYKAKSLIAACLSANLTRAGWWENVEVCHIERIEEGEITRLREDLLSFLSRIERLTADRAADGNASIQAIKSFLRTTEQRRVRSASGQLHTHFFDGKATVTEFLREAAGSALDGLYLEVISPYFDAGPASKPLSDLIEAFGPREVRVFLPKKDSGEALCSAEIVDWVLAQPNVAWGKLPRDVTRGGRSEEVKGRRVHAKVYRFFSANPKREYLFVGSVNLTRPAHQRGGNLETGFLIEVESPRRPEWWLEVERRRPTEFEAATEDEGAASTAGSRLSIRYHWDKKVAEALWDHSEPSPPLRVLRSGIPLFDVNLPKPHEWFGLGEAAAATVARELTSTSIFQVAGDRPEPVPLLVQEEGMAQRPSLLFDLSPGEILQYWALLTDRQRAAFLEAHAPDLALTGAGSELIARYARIVDADSFFDRFAGIFISYSQLERSVRTALDTENQVAAVYRLFGQKYDSLGTLLSRVSRDHEQGRGDLLEEYVIVLCSVQLLKELRRDFPEFFRVNVDSARRLDEQLSVVEKLRAGLLLKGDSTLPEFLSWFEDWFVKRAKPIEDTVS